VPISNPLAGGGTGGFDISITGNTAGATALVSTGTLTLAGGNNITLSQAGQAISIIGCAGGACGTQTLSAAGTSVSGTGISLAIAAGNNIALATATGAGSMTITINGANIVSSLNGSTGAMSISAGAGIGIGQANSTITISASVQTVSASLTALGNTTSSSAGTFTNLINVSGAGIVSVGVGNGSITISAPAPAYGTNTISASGTSIAGTALSLAVAAGANVSLQTATAAGSMTISVSGLNAVSASGFASSTGTMVISAGPGIALSTGANTITISNSSPNLFSTISLSASGQTTGATSSGTANNVLAFSGMGGVSVGVGNGTISISGGAGGAAGTNTISASGTFIAGTALSLAIAAGANISLQTASAAGSLTISVSGENAVSANGFASSTGTMTISAGPNIALSTGASVIIISNLLPSKISMTQNLPLQEIGGSVVSASGTVTGTAGFGSSLFLQRIFLPAAMTLSEVDLALAISFNATSNGGGTLSQSFAMYSFGNSSSLATVLSASGTSSWQTGTSTSGAVVSLTQFQGGWSVPQIHPMTLATSSIAAGEYVVGNLLNFAQASSTWTIQLLGALASITNSTTISNVTNTGQTLGSFLSQSSGISFTTGYQSIAQLARTLDEATVAHASASGATLTTNSSYAYAAAARTLLTASTTSSYFFTGATSIGTGTAISSMSLSTQSIVPQYLTVPNLVYIGTNSTTSAFPSIFMAGLMSTGAIPTAITITGAGLTYSGVQAGAQPWFALVGS
jgi:filamentous hemagglutinin